MPYCKKCGNELLNGQFTCPKCGQNQTQIVEAEPPKDKVPWQRLLWMWALACAGGLIGIILAASIIGAKNDLGEPRYTKSNRTQAIIALILGIGMTALFITIYTTI